MDIGYSKDIKATSRGLEYDPVKDGEKCGGMERVLPQFKKLDTDGNGAISGAELKSMNITKSEALAQIMGAVKEGEYAAVAKQLSFANDAVLAKAFIQVSNSYYFADKEVLKAFANENNLRMTLMLSAMNDADRLKVNQALGRSKVQTEVPAPNVSGNSIAIDGPGGKVQVTKEQPSYNAIKELFGLYKSGGYGANATLNEDQSVTIELRGSKFRVTDLNSKEEALNLEAFISRKRQ